MKLHPIPLAWLVFLTLVGANSYAQTKPTPPVDAQNPTTQERLRQQERQRVQREQQLQTPDVRLDQPASDTGQLPRNETPCFLIKQIKLEGDAGDQFQWALQAADFAGSDAPDPALGKCLGSAAVSQVLKRVQNAIVEKGYITTRVLAASQDLSSGVLTLTLVPGRMRSVRLSQDSSQHINLWNAVPTQSGELLNLREVEQALENLKRSPTSEADFQIVPSQDASAQPGDSDLVITYKQAVPLRVNLSADDSGSTATGKFQGAATLSCDNCAGLSDLFYISYNQDLSGGNPDQRGTFGATVHYSIPLGLWQLGVTSSRSRYRQAVAGANQTYVYSGQSNNTELKLSAGFTSPTGLAVDREGNLANTKQADYLGDAVHV